MRNGCLKVIVIVNTLIALLMAGKRKNSVLFLESDGIVIEGDENLLKHATKYYADLFGPIEEHNIHIDNSLWDELEKVSSEDNLTFTKPFSKAEIKKPCFT